MNAVATEHLIRPHGGTLVDRTGERPEGVESLEQVALTSRELSDLDMLASGALSPLEGFMGSGDYERVVEEMRLGSGLAWALPVCLAVDAAPTSDRVALTDEAGRPLAVLDVEDVFEYDKQREAETVLPHDRGRAPRRRPALRAEAALPRRPRDGLRARGAVVSRACLRPVRDTHRVRREGWRRVVGFQTRNPIHRAHEYLTKVALETVDGLLIHPLVGETKSDDVPVATRVECYRILVDGYYPADRVLVAAFPAAMRYAGPREAIWHAICRKNYGCSHFIVGRAKAWLEYFS